jgi:hypothetical protein
VPSTHINHLTPRVLDIDLLHASMRRQGVDMLERIEGPPRWDGPELLLRQTSFKALARPRTMAEPDGTVVQGALRVRFGEVEARGTALTPGRPRPARPLPGRGRRRAAGRPVAQLAGRVPPGLGAALPGVRDELQRSGLAHFSWHADGGRLVPRPVVYEDFLPRSAAGIFQSNLTSAGETAAEQGAPRTSAGSAACWTARCCRARTSTRPRSARRSPPPRRRWAGRSRTCWRRPGWGSAERAVTERDRPRHR